MKLKPCPFCGSKNVKVYSLGGLHVKCFNCDARIGYYESIENAIYVWNRRVRKE